MISNVEETQFEEGAFSPDCPPSSLSSIIAVIPAYNERDTIDGIVRTAARYANDVIVVDDGSEDNTGGIAALAGATVIRIPRNSGKGHALGIGLSTAAMNGCNVVVCLDADGQHNPADIPRIVQPIVDGKADMVIGSRFLTRKSRDLIPSYRQIGQTILTSATNFRSPVKITDSQSGFRAFARNELRRFAYSEAGMGIESEMVRNAVRNGLRIQEVPIEVRYEGLDSSTISPGKHGISVMGALLKEVRSEHPLIYLGVTGLMLVLLGILFGLHSISQYLSVDSLPIGATLVALMLTLTGILFMLTGLILNAINGIGSRKDNEPGS